MIYNVRKHTSTGRKRRKDELVASYYQNYMVKCNRCGHTFLMSYKEDKKLCTNCGFYYYKDKKLEFIERLNNARKNI